MHSQFEYARTAAQVLRARPHLDLPADERPFGCSSALVSCGTGDHDGAQDGRAASHADAVSADGDRVVLPASFGGRSDHPAWYRNLKVNPQVAVQIRSELLELFARGATDDERDRYWLQLIRMYPPYKGYRLSLIHI